MRGLAPVGRVEAVDATRAGLLVNLAAYWKLEEASGTRVDQLGVSDLSPVNAPGNNTGKLGSAVQLVQASAQSVSRASNATLTMGSSDFTIQMWAYLNTIGGIQVGLAKGPSATTTSYEYQIILGHSALSDHVLFAISDGSNQTFVEGAALSAATWTHILMWSDHGTGRIYLEINGTQTSVANSRNPQSAGLTFNLGQDASSASFHMGGRLDEVAIWKRVLTVAERAYLYNSGNGRSLY
jgi:hypothetical protein